MIIFKLKKKMFDRLAKLEWIALFTSPALKEMRVLTTSLQLIKNETETNHSLVTLIFLRFIWIWALIDHVW